MNLVPLLQSCDRLGIRFVVEDGAITLLGRKQAVIVELDRLIKRYCSLKGVISEESMGLLAHRRLQSAAIMPASIAWFQAKINGMECG